MLIYLLFLTLVSVEALFLCTDPRGAELAPDEKQKRRRIFLCLSCAELVIFVSMRGISVGADTKTYVDALKHYTGISIAELFTAPLVYPFDFEPGYFFFTKLCGFLRFPVPVFFAVIALVIYAPVFRYIEKFSVNPWLSVLIYFALTFFPYSLGIFRQMMALSIVLRGIEFIAERKFIKYLLVILLAASFHITALVMLPLYFLLNIDWSNLKLVAGILAAEAFLLVGGRYVISLATVVFPQFKHYLGGEYDTQGGSYTNLFILNAIFICYVIVWRRWQIHSVYTSILIAQLVIGILLQTCGYHMGLFGRIVPYGSIALLIAVPDIIEGVRLPYREKIFATGVAAAALFALILLQYPSNQYICPFTFIWQ